MKWLAGLLLGTSMFAASPLVVVSIDGLDNRYLTEADKLGLKTPNLRKMMREGQTSRGVIGSVPTVTWPSHVTIITGVDPVKHGILSNWRPPGEKYLKYSQIQVPTLLGAAHAAGITTASVNWPTTLDSPDIDWNLPEVFAKRRGGFMDLKSIEAKAKPVDLVKRIAAGYPSFATEWMDDRTRTQAVVWLLKNAKPGLLLVHLVDLDSEQHDNGPFSRESIAQLEHLDSLLGQILAALPKGGRLALVSDHGFDRVDRITNPQAGAPNAVQTPGLVVAPDEATAALLRKQDGVGREVPLAEYASFPSNLPAKPAAVFEPSPGVMFGAKPGPAEEIGNHGHWPMRYRSVYVLWGTGLRRESLPEFPMKEIAGRLAAVLGLKF